MPSNLPSCLSVLRPRKVCGFSGVVDAEGLGLTEESLFSEGDVPGLVLLSLLDEEGRVLIEASP